jgi:hypothetical protein
MPINDEEKVSESDSGLQEDSDIDYTEQEEEERKTDSQQPQ